MGSSAAQPSGAGSGTKHAAGAYDVRNVIAGLIGFYGIVLVIVGVAGDGEAEAAKTGGMAANLWAGVAMLVFAAAFALWSRLRPVVVDPGADVTGDGDRPSAH